MSSNADYHMSLQKLSSMFGGNMPGLFIMKTKSQGQVLINTFGFIEAVDITNDDIIIDNQQFILTLIEFKVVCLLYETSDL